MCARDQFRQLVIGLRADDQVDRGGAVHDFLALGLGHTAGDGDRHAAFTARFLLFAHLLEAADFGIDLLGCLFTYMACIEQDEVGPFGAVGHLIAQRTQDIGHAFAVIDVHLTAIGLDV